MTETHYIRYEYYDDERDNRNYWECTNCGLAGSVSHFNDPEAAAERAHGDIPLGVISEGEKMS